VVKDSDAAWHVVGASLYYDDARNTNSIGIEMCYYMNNGRLDISDKVISRTVELTCELMMRYGIPAERVVRHCDVTRKVCPEPMVSDGTRWKFFIDRITAPVTRGVKVWQYQINLTAAQRWRIEPHDGYVCLRSTASPDLMLDVSGASFVQRTDIWAYTENWTDAQKFVIELHDGYSVIRPLNTPGLAVDIDAASVESSARVQLYADNGTYAQRFVFVPTDNPDMYNIVNAKSLYPIDLLGGGR